MTTVGQVKTHQAFMRLHDRLVHLQVCRGARQALDINTPFLSIEVECLESTLLAEGLNRVNVLVTTVVTRTGVPLGVLVGHRRAEGIVDGTGGDVLGGDQEDRFALAFDLEVLVRVRMGAIAERWGWRTNHNLLDLGVAFAEGSLDELWEPCESWFINGVE